MRPRLFIFSLGSCYHCFCFLSSGMINSQRKPKLQISFMINDTKLRDNVFIKSGGLVKHGCQVCLVTGTVATCSQSRNSFTLPPRTITPSRVQAAASAGIVNTASGEVRCLSSPVRYSDTCTVVECRLEKCSSVDVFKNYLVLVPPPPASRGRGRR